MLYGAHVSSAGGISTAIDRAEELGCDAVQIFTQSPQMWKPTVHSDEQVARFRERREEAGIEAVVCHALYLVNLAGADKELHRKSVIAMRASMETAAAIGADGVVFHVGSHLGKGLAAGYRRGVPALRQLLELTNDRLWLVLENAAGAGSTMGRSVDELAVFFERLDRHERLGICLDSCHWWVSGVDVTSPDALDQALGELDESIGLDRLCCLHVNDAAAALASNRDRHALRRTGRGVGAEVDHEPNATVAAWISTCSRRAWRTSASRRTARVRRGTGRPAASRGTTR